LRLDEAFEVPGHGLTVVRDEDAFLGGGLRQDFRIGFPDSVARACTLEIDRWLASAKTCNNFLVEVCVGLKRGLIRVG
jgi:hypothetical protein